MTVGSLLVILLSIVFKMLHIDTWPNHLSSLSKTLLISFSNYIVLPLTVLSKRQATTPPQRFGLTNNIFITPSLDADPLNNQHMYHSIA